MKDEAMRTAAMKQLGAIAACSPYSVESIGNYIGHLEALIDANPCNKSDPLPEVMQRPPTPGALPDESHTGRIAVASDPDAVAGIHGTHCEGEPQRLPGSDGSFRVDPGSNGPQIVLINEAGRGFWMTVESLRAIQEAVANCEPDASWACPHCEKIGPHQHAIDRKGFVHDVPDSGTAQDAARYLWLKAHMGPQRMFPLPGEARPRIDVRFPCVERRSGGIEWDIADADRLDGMIDAEIAKSVPERVNSEAARWEWQCADCRRNWLAATHPPWVCPVCSKQQSKTNSPEV